MVVSLQKISDLNEQGWVMYYTPRCGYCTRVKNKVGPAGWNLMNKIDCSKQSCDGIRGVPTWVNSFTSRHWDGDGVFT